MVRFPNVVRRVRNVTKRIYGDLIVIAETLVYTLTEALVIVTDYVVNTKTLLFKLLGFGETIIFSDKVIQTFKSTMSTAISEIIDFKIYLIEQVSILKSIILRVNISESVPISDKSITRFFSSKATSISDGIKNITIRVRDTLSTTRSLLLKILSIDESLPISDRSIHRFLSSKSLDISDEIKNITTGLRESLSFVKTLLLELHLPETITITDNSITRFLVSKAQDVTDSLSYLVFKIHEPLSFIKGLLFNLSISESVSIADTISTFKSFLSKVYDITDSFTSKILASFTDTLSLEDLLKFKILDTTGSISISDSIDKSQFNASKDLSINEFKKIDTIIRKQDPLSTTKAYEGEKTCTVCYNCDVCELDTECLNCVSCDGCNVCQRCNTTCYKCDSSCYTCYSCNVSCQTCQSCYGGCDLCDACYLCVGICYVCYSGCDLGCDSCDLCVGCHYCVICEIEA